MSLMIRCQVTGLTTYTFPDGAQYVGEWKNDKPNGQTCKCWCIPLPDTGRRVCADKEDGAAEVRLTPTGLLIFF